jgi:hypothetical protein
MFFPDWKNGKLYTMERRATNAVKAIQDSIFKIQDSKIGRRITLES